jgi:hypothetical protein
MQEIKLYENNISPIFIYVIGSMFLLLLFIVALLLLFILLKRDYYYNKSKIRHKYRREEGLCGKESESIVSQ